jgi:hypothetical protein
MCGLFLYLIPFMPLAPRLWLVAKFHSKMGKALGEGAADREGHRSLVVALAGFSFTGLLGLVALPGALTERALPIWYVLISFVAYLGALNLQDYKSHRWHDQIGDALTEIATLGLILSVVSFVLNSDLDIAFRVAATGLAVSVWLMDFVIRIVFNYQYLSACRS